MNLDLYNAFSEAVFPAARQKHLREQLFAELKAGRFKEFNEEHMQKVVAVHVTDGKLPKLYCEVVREVLPTADKQNWKILAHCAGCEDCKSKVV